MDAYYTTRLNIKKVLQEFDTKNLKVKHKDYLEGQIQNLEKLVLSYRVQSKNSELPPRIRARSRDLEQNAMGLLNGIKFSLSFIEHQNEEEIA